MTLTVLAPFTVQTQANQSSKDYLVCWALPGLMARFHDNHVEFQTETTALEQRLVELYSKRMDPSKVLLLQDDFDALKKKVGEGLANAREGRCDFFDWLKVEQVRWQDSMEAYVKEAMADPKLQIDRDLTLQVDPDKRMRPKTAAERDQIRRKLLHFQLANYVAGGTELSAAKKKLVHRYELITRRVKEQSKADVYSGFLNTFANALDPHSTYFSADDLEDFRISMDLSLEGIGAVLSSRDGYTTVREVVPGGAADRQGDLKTKDKIIAVTQMPDGESVDVIDMSLRDVVKKIRGKKGSQVKLTVLRKGERTETLHIVITRDKIDLKEQAAKLKWESVKRGGQTLKIAVIQLPSFYGGDRARGARNCTDDVKQLLKTAQDENADGLVLDLSRNGGGLLNAAVDISGLFLAEGAVVAIDGNPSNKKVLNDDDESIHFGGPMVVMTSRASASASEILAGALKDYQRAVIVGDDHTFGKGTVQNIVSLPQGLGALKVTTAHFFRPGGESTQHSGVTSDIIVPSAFNNDEYGERHQTYALPPRAVESFRSSRVNAAEKSQRWVPVTASQLKKLRASSQARQTQDEELKKIVANLEKRAKNKGVIKISEILDDPENKGDAEDDDTPKDDDKLSPRVKEGIQILADLIKSST